LSLLTLSNFIHHSNTTICMKLLTLGIISFTHSLPKSKESKLYLMWFMNLSARLFSLLVHEFSLSYGSLWTAIQPRPWPKGVGGGSVRQQGPLDAFFAPGPPPPLHLCFRSRASQGTAWSKMTKEANHDPEAPIVLLTTFLDKKLF
jgi:hypothetical protein